MEVLHWLLGCAIKFEYGEFWNFPIIIWWWLLQFAEEAPEKYNNPDNRHTGLTSEQPMVTSSNPLDKLDFSSTEFRAGVDRLADKLQVNLHSNMMYYRDQWGIMGYPYRGVCKMLIIIPTLAFSLYLSVCLVFLFHIWHHNILTFSCQIMRHPDHLVRLTAMSRLVSERLGASSSYVR